MTRDRHCKRWRFFCAKKKELIWKLNREIQEYTEAMYFGLSLRQFVCAVLACGVAVGLYFLLRPHMGMETVSWVCILGAVPFAAIGFIKYHGMTAEKFLWVWIKSEILMPKYLVFRPENGSFEVPADGRDEHRTSYWCEED